MYFLFTECSPPLNLSTFKGVNLRFEKYLRELDGGRQAIFLEPNTVSEEYSIVWRRARIDTDELIYFKTVKKLTYRELGAILTALLLMFFGILHYSKKRGSYE